MENRNPETDPIVVYKTFDNAASASILKGLLEANDIECFVDENSNFVFSPYNQAFGAVRLHVFERDLPLIEQLMQNQPKLDDDDEVE